MSLELTNTEEQSLMALVVRVLNRTLEKKYSENDLDNGDSDLEREHLKEVKSLIEASLNEINVHAITMRNEAKKRDEEMKTKKAHEGDEGFASSSSKRQKRCKQ